MPVSKAQQKAVAKYEAKVYDKTLIRLPKGQLDTIKTHAEARGESVNGFINRAIDGQMERDTGGSQEAAGVPTGEVVCLPTEALKTAQEAAEAAGEGLPQFVTRAIESRAALDKRRRR